MGFRTELATSITCTRRIVFEHSRGFIATFTKMLVSKRGHKLMRSALSNLKRAFVGKAAFSFVFQRLMTTGNPRGHVVGISHQSTSYSISTAQRTAHKGACPEMLLGLLKALRYETTSDFFGRFPKSRTCMRSKVAASAQRPNGLKSCRLYVRNKRLQGQCL